MNTFNLCRAGAESVRSILRLSESRISEAKDIKRKEQRERFLFALFFLQANSDAESDSRVVGAVECVVRYVR